MCTVRSAGTIPSSSPPTPRVRGSAMRAWLAGLALTLGCTDTGDGQGQAECTRLGSPQSVAPDEATGVGTAAQLADEGAGVRRRALMWWGADRATPQATRVALELTADASSARVVSRTTPGGDIICGPLLQLDAVLRFETEDGAFEEEFDGVLSTDGAEARFEATLPRSQLRGSYDGSWYPESEADYELRLSMDDASGSLSLAQDSDMLLSGEVASW